MSKFAGVIIEQDPKDDMRFRITMHEDAVDKTAICKGVDMPTSPLTSIQGALDFARVMKRVIRDRAAELIWQTDMFAWIREHGGSVCSCRYAAKHKGDQIRTVYVQKGQPMPYIINDHFRVGLSITFYERDKAMLFKLRWMNEQQAAAA